MKTNIIKIYTENSEFQQIEALRSNRTKRNKRGEFFVEGVRPISLAVDQGWEINALLFTQDKRQSQWAEEILSKAKAEKLIELPYQLLKKLSQKEETSELIALAAIPSDDLSRIPVQDHALVVVLDRPIYPRNIGTILRSCDALHADGVIITGHSADLYDPATIRASTGSLFCVPAVRLPSHKELIPWIKHTKHRFSELQIVGTSEDAQVPIQDHDFTLPTILLAGNETRGLSENYKALCDTMVNIPMVGCASSLNLACATSIILYEIDRQRTEQAKLHSVE